MKKTFPACFSFVFAGCVATTTPMPGTTPAVAEQYPSSGKIQCEGNDSANHTNVTISDPVVGIVVAGNCSLTIENCQVNAATGVQASGNGSVTLKNCDIAGATAFDVSGNGHVSIEGSRVHGRVIKVGNGRVDDLGGNTWK